MFKKGYLHDAGYDIICDKQYIFEPMKMTTYELNCCITPLPNTCAMLIARTSAAKQGLIVSMCPIDADYTGKLTAIVFNGSNKPIIYEAGQSFLQVIFLQLATSTIEDWEVNIKNPNEKRNNHKIGSTGS